jgi:hypothetical protein
MQLNLEFKQSGLHGEFEASLGYISKTLSQNKNKQKTSALFLCQTLQNK